MEKNVLYNMYMNNIHLSGGGHPRKDDGSRKNIEDYTEESLMDIIEITNLFRGEGYKIKTYWKLKGWKK